MDEDFLLDNEHEENEDWYCQDCEMGPIHHDKTKCPRCGFKMKNHFESDAELDEFGDPIDEKYYEEHY